MKANTCRVSRLAGDRMSKNVSQDGNLQLWFYWTRRLSFSPWSRAVLGRLRELVDHVQATVISVRPQKTQAQRPLTNS